MLNISVIVLVVAVVAGIFRIDAAWLGSGFHADVVQTICLGLSVTFLVLGLVADGRRESRGKARRRDLVRR
jgi:hypothetical protein